VLRSILADVAEYWHGPGTQNPLGELSGVDLTLGHHGHLRVRSIVGQARLSADLTRGWHVDQWINASDRYLTSARS
jgi:hypothetical protein